MTPSTRSLAGNRYLRGFLSALVPGLGQLVARQYRRAALLALPLVILLGVLLVLLVTTDWLVLASRLVDPQVIALLLVVQVGLLALRLAATVLAVDPRRRPSARGGALIVVLLAFVVLPQAYLGYVTAVAYDTANTIFAPSNGGQAYVPTGTPEPEASLDPSDDPFAPVETPTPGASESPSESPTATALPTASYGGGRITILLIGNDAGVGRSTSNTDTMIVASLDPVSRTVSMLSLPRDTVDVPLPDGRVWTAKLNSLAAWVRHHPGQFPGAPAEYPGQAVLAAALSNLTGVHIDYWAQVDLPGLIRVVDAVGGVNVNVTRGFCDPNYTEYGLNGFAVMPGRYHMSGKQALAYARVRHAAGESDFTRAARQQEVIVALRDRMVSGGFLSDPARLLRALGQTVLTNVPPSVISQWAPYGRSVTRGHVYQEVVDKPLVNSDYDRRGYVLKPDIPGIRALASRLFPNAGTMPIGFSPLPDTSATAPARNLPTYDCHPAPQPNPTPTPTATPTATPTELPTPTPTGSPAPTPTPTDSPKPTPTHTPKPTHTPTPRPTHTATPRPTVTPSPSKTPSPTPTAAATATG